MNNIKIYHNENGESEIEDYIKKLKMNNSKDNRIKLKKIRLYMRLLSNFGLSLGEPYIKHIEDEIWELRPIRDRILFASLYNNKFILLSIFVKKSQKTPKREIEKAKRLLKDFKRRNDEDE